MGHTSEAPVRIIERLETRRLFTSYATADYYLMTPGTFWDYQGKEDGGIQYHSTDTAAATTYRGTPSIAFHTSEKEFLSDYEDRASYSNDYMTFSPRKGLKLLGFDHNSRGESIALHGEVPIPLLPAVLKSGTVIKNPTVKLKGTSHLDHLGDMTGGGEVSTTVTVVGISPVDAADLTFHDVIKVVTHRILSFNMRATDGGGTYSAMSDETESDWYARGIGLVVSRIAGSDTIEGDEKTQHDNYWSQEYTTALSSRVKARANIAAAVVGDITISGSEGDDDIRITGDRRDYNITMNSITRHFHNGGVNWVIVKAKGGNDRVDLQQAGKLVQHLRIDAGDGDDYVYGTMGADLIVGGAGRNSLYGGGGDDSITGGDDADLIYGDEGNDSILAGAGDDTIEGGDGNDLLNGRKGNDLILGGTGHDTLFGETGNDTLQGQAHADVLDGGDGIDYASSDAGDYVFGIEHALA